MANEDLACGISGLSPISMWGTERVSSWLEQNQLEQYCDIFQSHNIDGYALLRIGHSEMTELRVTIGCRIKLDGLLSNLRYEAQQQELLRQQQQPYKSPLQALDSQQSTENGFDQD